MGATGSRFGRLYGERILRPLAEQAAALFATAGLAPRVVADVMCDHGVMTAALGDATGRGGRIIAVDTDDDNLVAAHAAAPRGVVVHTVRTDGATIHVDDGSCDAAVSLLTLAWSHVDQLAREMRRVTQAGGAVVVVIWGERPSLFEQIIIDAAGETGADIDAPPLVAPNALAAALPDVQWTELRDVARFDGQYQFWDAVLDRRPTLAGHPGLVRIKQAAAPSLERYENADGTLIIPFVATAAVSRAGPS